MSAGGWTTLIASLSGGPPEQMRQRLYTRLLAEPACPVTRYLLGCSEFERGRPATAVEHLMIAHRGEPTLESASLLVFAGLNWIGRRPSALLPVLLDTWEEYHRPEFDRSPRERVLLDALAAPADGLDRMSPLARQLWRLPIATLRSQLRAAVSQRAAGPFALLLSPA